MKERLIAKISLLFFLITIVYPASFPKKGEIKKEGINIRTDSRINSPSIGKLKKEEIVTVVDEKFGWYKIVLPARFNCYVASKYLEKIDKYKAKCKADRVNIRHAPSLNSLILGRINKNSIVKVYNYGKEWSKISCFPYAYGWVYKKFVKIYEKRKKISKEGTKKKEKKLIAQKKKTIFLKPISSQKTPLAEGILKKLKREIKNDINYFLENEGGVVLLKIKKELHPENFLNKKVKIYGKNKIDHYVYIEVEEISP
ncbi:MAG: hypothetical protein B6D55_08095 [Candidatus Omnitrophica bacterium 4484_70.2]|nr:MAG: hypothetical protein B6D55_08095 [Candidatus Omnitrophica bacterium 4484_70.2]